MSTNANIGLVSKDKSKIAVIYLHWDGYLAWAGKILLENYNTFEKAEELLKHGDISSIGGKCDKPKGHSYKTAKDGYTVYYGRDRGETGTLPSNVPYSKKDKAFDNTYNYLFEDGVWKYSSYKTDGFVVLTSAAIKKDEEN